MQMPAADDTIIAVSSGWEPAAIGIVRLSGPDAFELVGAVGPRPPTGTGLGAAWSEARVRIDRDTVLPATLLWFRKPRSYTGQDLVELHTVGCLPLLRRLTARLIERGARRALPGEFTARAYLAGKLDARQAESVLALINARSESSLRHAARLRRGADRQLLSDLTSRLTELLALIEAGIDFVEEEDIRFITAAEVGRSIDGLLQLISAHTPDVRPESWTGKPHIALAGLPNAGKSTLFNALLGYERAIVAPILGTTRDVLSAEIQVNGISAVLQDCAGLGGSAGELELAAHLAAERAASQAEIVLWVHDGTAEWDPREAAACAQIPPARRVLVRSKCELAEAGRDDCAPFGFAATVNVSAPTGAGLERLAHVLAERLEAVASSHGGGRMLETLVAVRRALERARGCALGDSLDLTRPEIVALELRTALEQLRTAARGPVCEDLLDWIFSQFCVGK